MACPFCGSPTRHGAACRRAWADRGRRRQLTRAVADAAHWLELYGDDPGCISPTGRRLFAALVTELRRLRTELAATRQKAAGRGGK